MSVLTRWTAKLAARRKLLDRARRSVVYWGRRAGSAHGRHMLTEARARYELRKSQVAEAQKVLARHAEVTGMSREGVALVASEEGFRAYVYDDATGLPWGHGRGQSARGTPTQGYGETHGITPGKSWSRVYALERLKKRLDSDYLGPVLRLCKAVGFHPEQHEADALGSLVYNTGPGILAAGHSMGDALRSKNRRRIADAFLVYDDANPGDGILRPRRRAERALFLS